MHLEFSYIYKSLTKQYYQNSLMHFIVSWNDGINRTYVFLSTMPTQGLDFGVNVTYLEFSYKY